MKPPETPSPDTPLTEQELVNLHHEANRRMTRAALALWLAKTLHILEGGLPPSISVGHPPRRQIEMS